MQIDRELAYLVTCGASPTFDGVNSACAAVLTPSSAAGSGSGSGEDILTIKTSAHAHSVAGDVGVISSASGTSASKSKKKKKKGNPLNTPEKVTLLAPQDNPLLFLTTEFSPDAFVPKKFAVSAGGKGLSQELDRLTQSAQKQCGDPAIASEIFAKLLNFPKEIRYVFLMHLIKNPFPDHPYSLINLWKVIPMPTQKEDRGNFMLIMLDLITSLSELNDVWKDIIYVPPTNESSDQLRETDTTLSKGEKRATSANISSASSTDAPPRKKPSFSDTPGVCPTNDTPVVFHLPGTDPAITPLPRMMLMNLRQYKNLVPDKIRLQNGLSRGKGRVTPEQQGGFKGGGLWLTPSSLDVAL
jgi:hypothetical protein